jgi:hypothetical protein
MRGISARNVAQVRRAPKNISHSGWFSGFENAFPTVEKRLAQARKLVDTTIPDQTYDYPSRPFLATHWGEDRALLRGLANFVYRLPYMVNTDPPQMVAVIKTGSVADIFDETQDYVEQDITIQLARLGGQAVEHRIDSIVPRVARLAKNRPKEEKPPYISYRLRLPIEQPAITISADCTRSARVEAVAPASGSLVVYHALVPLPETPELDLYRKGAFLEPTTCVVGAVACVTLVEALSEKLSHESAQEAMQATRSLLAPV